MPRTPRTVRTCFPCIQRGAEEETAESLTPLRADALPLFFACSSLTFRCLPWKKSGACNRTERWTGASSRGAAVVRLGE